MAVRRLSCLNKKGKINMKKQKNQRVGSERSPHNTSFGK